MVTQIQLGNIYQSNGKTVVGGSQSGLDTKSLIDSLVTIKQQPATDLQDKIKINGTKTDALTQLQDILSRLKDAADLLRNPPGVANESSDIFSYRNASVSSSTGADASNYMSVTAEPGTNIQNFEVEEIHQLALGTKQSSNTFSLVDANGAVVSATPAAGQFGAGTFTLRNATGGADVSVTFNDGDSLQTVANKMNAVKDQTGIQATVLKVGTGSPNSTFQLVFTSTKTGTTYGFDLANANTLKSDTSGVWGNITKTTTQPAQNAQLTIDHVAVERETNSISDLIPGMTFNLKQPTTGGTTLAVSVQPDTDSVKSAITTFVNTYNEFRIFASKQSQIGDDGKALDTAVLNDSTAMNTAVSNVASEVTNIVAGITGNNPSRLADIGISFVNFNGDTTNPATKNIMQIDDTKLQSALQSNYQGVANLFEFQMTSDNPNVVNFSRTNALNAVSVQINVDRTNGTYNATYVDKSGVSHSASFTATPIQGSTGVTLTGAKGSGLDGLVLIYASNADATVNLSMTQGMGDRLYNTLNGMLDTKTGTIATEQQSIVDTNTRYQTQIDKINDQVTQYRDQLTQQYANLEAALSKANNILQVLDAQQQARNQSSN